MFTELLSYSATFFLGADSEHDQLIFFTVCHSPHDPQSYHPEARCRDQTGSIDGG